MKEHYSILLILLILLIMVLGCTEIPDELREDSKCEGIFNPKNKFCYKGVIYNRCDGMAYDPSTHVCEDDVARPARCGGGSAYNPLESDCCGSSKYALSSQFCQSPNVVKSLCGISTYAASEFCQSGTNTVLPLCGTSTYSSSQFCQIGTGDVLSLCGSQTFSATEFCQSGTNAVLPRCGTSTYTSSQFCSGTQVYSLCNGRDYEPANQTCQSNVVVTKCGTGWYNPANQRCQSDVVETRCGTGSTYHNPATEECCGNGKYTVATHFCQNGINNTVLPRCGTSSYTSSQFCSGIQVYSLCGGNEYEPANQRCQSNVVETRCGTSSSWYDTTNANLRCQSNVVETKCGTSSSWYDTTNANLRCQSNLVETKCGTSSSWYDATNANLRCQSNLVETKCGTSSSWYDATNANLRCQSNVVETKCGTSSSWYDATNANLRCQSNLVETKCGTSSSWYDATNTNLRCQSNVVETKCGATGWYVATNVNFRCEGDVVEAKCGDSYWYNSTIEYCSNGTKETYGSVTDDAGKTYRTVVIGTQTWMAENLNYNAEGSKCYDNVEFNCDVYGRLYNWSTAMNGSASSTANPSGVRGICPEGWHIPSDAEWDILSSFVGGSNTEGKYLKSQEGWYSCGHSSSGKNYLCEDTYGFAALPGGFCYSYYSGGSYGGRFYSVGYSGYWWTASEGNSDNAYFRFMNYSYGYAILDYGDKSHLRSVRCLKD
jgi:uncharacterized protein (TIGR02145 family)